MGEHLSFKKFRILWYMPIYTERLGLTHLGVAIFGPARAVTGVPFLNIDTGHLYGPEEGQTDPRQNPEAHGVPLGWPPTGTPIKIL